MDIIWEELSTGLPNTRQLVHFIVRLLASAIFGALIGLQRERAGKPAGLRTHILTTIGTTLFILVCLAYEMSSEALSRIIQGIITGIGFLGAGSILKLNEKRDIQGLTTASGIWMSSAIGVTVGLGSLGLALIATILTLLVLTVIGSLESSVESKVEEESDNNKEL